MAIKIGRIETYDCHTGTQIGHGVDVQIGSVYAERTQVVMHIEGDPGIARKLGIPEDTPANEIADAIIAVTGVKGQTNQVAALHQTPLWRRVVGKGVSAVHLVAALFTIGGGGGG